MCIYMCVCVMCIVCVCMDMWHEGMCVCLCVDMYVHACILVEYSNIYLNNYYLTVIHIQVF